MVWSARKLEKGSACIELQWLLPIIPNYHIYPTLESRIHWRLKSVQTLCFFLKDADLIDVNHRY
jgi:hypothetical protein